jgi:hypothetical protein
MLAVRVAFEGLVKAFVIGMADNPTETVYVYTHCVYAYTVYIYIYLTGYTPVYIILNVFVVL